MKVSAVVLSFNSSRHIETCVRSLHDALRPLGPSDVFVVDNGSTDGSIGILERLSEEFAGFLHCRFMPTNTGTTYSRNIALRECEGDYILIIDSDATVTSGAIKGLIRVLEEDPKCGMTVPRVVYPDGRFQKSTDRFPTVQHKLRRLLFLRQMESEDVSTTVSRIDVDCAISAVWLLRRELLETVGFLDERIFYSPEDVDYCMRIWMAGYRIVYNLAVTAVHDAQELSRNPRFSIFALRHLSGLAYYFFKHRYAFSLNTVYTRLGRTSESA